MRPAPASRPARPTSPSRRERFQSASRWVLKPIRYNKATYRSSTASYSFFSLSALGSALPFEGRGLPTCFTPLCATFETGAVWLCHFKPFQTGGGWGGSHTHPDAHTHAHTHALTPA